MTRKIPNAELLLLLSAALLLTSPAAAQSFRDRERSEFLDYVYGRNADASCAVCLNASRKFYEDRKRSALEKRTAGMVLVKAGEYFLGSPDGVGDPDERPGGEIYLDAYYIDKYEVTIEDYLAFAKETSANYPEWAAPNGKYNIETGKDDYYRRLRPLVKSCGKCAVFGVDWKDAKAYCEWKKKRLPTEAEWEAAARAGTKGLYSFGSEAEATQHAWIETNSREIPHPVGGKKPNAWGLYDMHGNVWEWVSDVYEKTYYASRPRRNPTGRGQGNIHVIRGGSWSGDADHTRSANRATAKQANDDIGFRCALSEKDVDKEAAAPSPRRRGH